MYVHPLNVNFQYDSEAYYQCVLHQSVDCCRTTFIGVVIFVPNIYDQFISNLFMVYDAKNHSAVNDHNL